MSEPTYTLTLTESERTAFAKVLGGLVTKMINAPIFVEAPNGGTQQARAVISPKSNLSDVPNSFIGAAMSGLKPPVVAPANTAPVIEQRDRWARDRKGNEVPWPTGCEEREVTIWKTEQKPAKKEGGAPYLKVTWQAAERGYVDANCFDKVLFPWLINQSGKKTTMYLVKAGQYLNVVGVRA